MAFSASGSGLAHLDVGVGCLFLDFVPPAGLLITVHPFLVIDAY